MNRTTAELLLIISTTFFLSVLMFLAGPLRKVMNKMDNGATKQFITLLFQLGQRTPFLLIVTNLTALGMIPYFVAYGFRNWWFIAGLAVFLLAGVAAKAAKVPVYKKIASLDAGSREWAEERQKMHKANMFQAVFTFASIGLMTLGLFY
jgi:hypothetical protein